VQSWGGLWGCKNEGRQDAVLCRIEGIDRIREKMLNPKASLRSRERGGRKIRVRCKAKRDSNGDTGKKLTFSTCVGIGSRGTKSYTVGETVSLDPVVETTNSSKA